jgi:hypothetical protein
MGFVGEHSLHRPTRRLWSWHDEFGNERVMSAGVDALLPTLTTG